MNFLSHSVSIQLLFCLTFHHGEGYKIISNQLQAEAQIPSMLLVNILITMEAN